LKIGLQQGKADKKISAQADGRKAKNFFEFLQVRPFLERFKNGHVITI